jgi:Flp pilus assembly pilin Flp
MTSWFAEFGASMRAFWLEDQGQDLIENSLLIAFVALASASLFIIAGGNIKSIWTTTNSQLAAAAASATS